MNKIIQINELNPEELRELIGNELDKRLAGSDSPGDIIEMPIPAQTNSSKVFYFRSEVIKAMKPIKEVA